MLVLCLGAGCDTKKSMPPCYGCNVVLITLDTLRADHLGIYGYELDTSPNINSFAGKATVFTENLSQSGTTVSSLASLHTSKFPSVDRLLTWVTEGPLAGQEAVLRESEDTLAEILARSGYSTAAVIGHTYAMSEWGAGQGFEVIEEVFEAPEDAPSTMERAGRVLRNLDKGPFFLWIHFRQPHSPYNAPQKLFDQFYASSRGEPTFYTASLWPYGWNGDDQYLLARPHIVEEVNRWAAQAKGEHIATYRTEGGNMELTRTAVEQVVAHYDANIRAVDQQVGTIIDTLDELGLTNETVVVLAADHGENLGERHHIGHNRLDWAVLHTPLIIRVPGQQALRVESPTMNVDILPTVLGRVGVEIPKRIRGRDLFGRPGREVARYADYSGSRTIVMGNHKLVVGVAKHKGVALFDIEHDPSEESDIADEHPELVAEGLQLIKEIQASSLAIEPDSADPDIIKMLTELGYIFSDD